MKRMHLVLLVPTLLAGNNLMTADPPRSGPGEKITRAGDSEIGKLAWLQGHWSGETEGAKVETVYSGPEGGMILSATKEIRNGRTTMFDFERFEEKEGGILLTPYPFGRASVSFEMTRCDPDRKEAVFENPSHDFPKRFTYRLAEKDRLLIRLEGEEKGHATTVEFDLKRL